MSNLICETIGHKFITVIFNENPHIAKSIESHLKIIMCKRCGLTREEIAKNETKN